MKYIKYMMIGFAALTCWACETDEPQFLSSESQQVTSVPVVTEVGEAFYNVLDLENAGIDFTVDLYGDAPISRVELYQSYNAGTAQLIETVSSFPAEVTIDAFEAIRIAGINADDLEAGDSFLYTFRIYTEDGREFLTQNSFRAPVACASTIPTGTYAAVTSGTSTDGCPPVNPVEDLETTVTLTSLGAGDYQISDFSAGLYSAWYGACYGGSGSAGTLTDVCNQLTLSATDVFGASVSGSGVYDPETGIITFSWINDFGDEGETVLTPQ